MTVSRSDKLWLWTICNVTSLTTALNHPIIRHQFIIIITIYCFFNSNSKWVNSRWTTWTNKQQISFLSPTIPPHSSFFSQAVKVEAPHTRRSLITTQQASNQQLRQHKMNLSDCTADKNWENEKFFFRWWIFTFSCKKLFLEKLFELLETKVINLWLQLSRYSKQWFRCARLRLRRLQLRTIPAI